MVEICTSVHNYWTTLLKNECFTLLETSGTLLGRYFSCVSIPLIFIFISALLLVVLRFREGTKGWSYSLKQLWKKIFSILAFCVFVPRWSQCVQFKWCHSVNQLHTTNTGCVSSLVSWEILHLSLCGTHHSNHRHHDICKLCENNCGKLHSLTVDVFHNNGGMNLCRCFDQWIYTIWMLWNTFRAQWKTIFMPPNH